MNAAAYQPPSPLLLECRPLTQERLDHANASITFNTYAHVFGGNDQKAVDVLEEVSAVRFEKD